MLLFIFCAFKLVYFLASFESLAPLRRWLQQLRVAAEAPHGTDADYGRKQA